MQLLNNVILRYFGILVFIKIILCSTITVDAAYELHGYKIQSLI